MQIIVSAVDVKNAPAVVQQWFWRCLGSEDPEGYGEVQQGERAAEEPKVEEAAPLTTPTEEPSPPPAVAESVATDVEADLLNRATEFIKAKGEGPLVEIMNRMGLKRVRECPPDRIPELLAELSVNA